MRREGPKKIEEGGDGRRDRYKTEKLISTRFKLFFSRKIPRRDPRKVTRKKKDAIPSPQ